VRKHLPFEGQSYRGLQTVKLDHIVGSVNRYRDFDRVFLPKQRQTQYRWQSIDAARANGVTLPPIDLYQIGDIYFVKDGNHRVSVARTQGQSYIDAYVTEIKVPVAVTPETAIDDLINEQAHAYFLHETRLNVLRPEVDVHVTSAGGYEKLLEHISVHRWYLSQERQAEIPYDEAVTSWVDNVYLPLLERIRAEEILKAFPKRTPTDLYLWVSEHRSELENAIGWHITPENAAADLLATQGAGGSLITRVGKKLIATVAPEELTQSGPPPGEWRAQRVAGRPTQRFFIDVLVAINGTEPGWCALRNALEIAQREQGYLHGLHIVPHTAYLELPETLAVAEEFHRRCQALGREDTLRIETGEVVPVLAERSRWADLLIVSLNHPPGTQPLEKLSSGFRNLLYRVACPLLAVPSCFTAPFEQALLAYDGSPKADEALFIAAHVAEAWGLPLVVVTATDKHVDEPPALAHALAYLQERGITAIPHSGAGDPTDIILCAAETHRSDLIIMGSYSRNPALQIVLGSTVDKVLRNAWQPLLICR